MFQKNKKKKTKLPLNKKGFSLVEILIAVGILVLITVPLAMNMISSSQINSKSKQTAAASDLTTSIMEIMQTIDLSDVMTDINWYTISDGTQGPADEYGTELKYTLIGHALKNYNVDSAFEAWASGGKYTPVSRPDATIQDRPASIKIGKTGDIVRSYFIGTKTDEYSFVLKNVESDEASVDVVATIKPEQKFSIINIISSAQTDVLYAKQGKTMNTEVAREFKTRNDQYITLYGGSKPVEARSQQWFEKNMERKITIDIKQSDYGNETTIIISAVYTVDTDYLECDCLREGDRKITKTLGSLSTNSTSELARGVYLSYYPLEDFSNGTPRDTIVINNKNELSLPVFLVAMSGDNIAENMSNYHPILEVYELSDVVYDKVARTTVCSNVNDTNWSKRIEPAGRTLTVKNLGNASMQQTLFRMTIKVYRHREASYNAEGIFEPRDKDLLIETSGTFIDTSEKLDIESDKTTGLSPVVSGEAKITLNQPQPYDGTEKKGVISSQNVDIEGIKKATDAGKYTLKVTPYRGCKWADGTTGTKTFTWEITRCPLNEDTIYTLTNLVYNGSLQIGVVGSNVSWSGKTQATDAGITYTAYATPYKNYAWADGTFETRDFQWRIEQKEVQVVWATGNNFDRWLYDGNTHEGIFEILVDGAVLPKSVCEPFVLNNVIKNIGSVTATIDSLSNKNYKLPTDGSASHVLTVISKDAAFVTLKTAEELTYNGEVQSAIADFAGVYFTETIQARDYNKNGYTLVAHLQDGYSWADGTTSPTKTISWNIKQLEAVLVWGELSWEFDGTTHSTTCIVANKIPGDSVTVNLRNNAIKNFSTTPTIVVAESLSNKNYSLPSNNKRELKIRKIATAYVETSDFHYDGYYHTGVYGDKFEVVGNGTTHARDVKIIGTDLDRRVGYYSVDVKPKENYLWEDGTDGTKTVYWRILPRVDEYARYEVFNWSYNGSDQEGVMNYYHTLIDQTRGTIHAKDVGTYITYLTPADGYQWKNGMSYIDPVTKARIHVGGTVKTIPVTWQIEELSFLRPSLKETLFEYDGEEKIVSINDIGNNNGYTTSGTFEATAAGTYTIVAKLKDGGTWFGGGTEDVTLTWKIEPREVTVNFDDNTWEYAKTNRKGTAWAGNLIGDDTCNFTYSYPEGSIINVGTKPFIVTGVDNPNYKLPSTGLESTMTITPRIVTITWPEQNFVYAPNTTHTYNPTIGRVMSGDETPVLTIKGNVQSDAGQHPVEITGITSANGNYGLPQPNPTTTMIIAKAKLASFTEKTFTYENKVHTNPVITTNCHVVVDATNTMSAQNVGTYYIYLEPNDNYMWTDGTEGQKIATWRINKATPTATVQGATGLIYDGNNQVLIKSAPTDTNTDPDGEVLFALGTTNNAVPPDDTAFTLSWSDMKKQTVGTYRIWYYIKATTNYNALTKAYVDVSISKQQGVVTTAPVGATNLKYENKNHNLLSSKGVSSSGEIEFQVGATTEGSWSTSIPQRKDANTSGYVVYYRAKANANYSAGDINYIIVKIAKANHSVTVNKHDSLTYKISVQSLLKSCTCATGTVTYSLTGGNDYTTTIPAKSNAGDYTVYIKVDGNTNYNEFKTTVSVKINKAKEAYFNFATATVMEYTGFVVKAPTTGFNDVEFSLKDGTWFTATYDEFLGHFSGGNYDNFFTAELYGIEMRMPSDQGKQYSIKVRPLENYTWEDGTENEKLFTWYIN